MQHGCSNNITGLILAGGLARRMAGQDKGLIQFRGIPIAQGIAQQLHSQCENICINANRNMSAYREFGYAVFPDELPDYQGPLAGMLTGLNHVPTPWMITTPCDGPFVAADYVVRMKSAVDANGHNIAVASCNGRLQPVYALLNQSLTGNLETFLNSKERKIDKWYQQHTYSVVDFTDSPEMFENINTPEQLQALERRI
jgi:molybdopterin-guanine dinucleotide biosynthesis protein A